jgi:hypothetical protein
MKKPMNATEVQFRRGCKDKVGLAHRVENLLRNFDLLYIVRLLDISYSLLTAVLFNMR